MMAQQYWLRLGQRKAARQYRNLLSVVVVIAGVAVSAPTNAADQRFTLSCKGETVLLPSHGIPGQRSSLLTVELSGKRGRYYDHDANEWKDLASVSATELLIFSYGDFSSRVNRVTGFWLVEGDSAGTKFRIEGVCNKVPLMAIPATKF